MTTLEERIERAGRSLDEQIDARLRVAAAERRRSTESVRSAHPSRTRVLLIAACIAVLALGVVGLVAVSLGSESSEPADDGFDTTDRWTSIEGPPIGDRDTSLTISSREGAMVFSGCCEPETFADWQDGAYLSRATGEWRALPPSPFVNTPVDVPRLTGVWGGDEFVLARDTEGDDEVQAAAFDPESFTWRVIRRNGDGLGPQYVPVGPTEGGRGFVVSVDDGRLAYGDVAGTDVADLPDRLGFVTSRVAATPHHYLEWVATDQGTRLAYLAADGGDWQLAEIPTDAWPRTDCPPDSEPPSTRYLMPIGPTIFAGLGDRFLLAGGIAGCSSAPSPSRTALVLDPVVGTIERVADVPVDVLRDMRSDSSTGHWTGEAYVTMTHEGRPLAYDPVADSWHVGPTLFDEIGWTEDEVNEPAGFDVGAAGDAIVISGGSFLVHQEEGGWIGVDGVLDGASWIYRPDLD